MFFLFAVPAILGTLAEAVAVVAVGTIVARGVNDVYDAATKKDESDE